MNKFLILSIACLLSSPTILARKANDKVDANANKQIEGISSLTPEEKMVRAKAESDMLVKNMVKQLKSPVYPEMNKELIETFKKFDNAYPTKEDFTSDYKSDRFISSVYYELPLLENYQQYNQELDNFLNVISGILQKASRKPDFDWSRFATETNNRIINNVIASGKAKTPNATYKLSYGPFFKNRESEASIPYLNKVIEKLQQIMNPERVSEENVVDNVLAEILELRNSLKPATSPTDPRIFSEVDANDVQQSGKDIWGKVIDGIKIDVPVNTGVEPVGNAKKTPVDHKQKPATKKEKQKKAVNPDVPVNTGVEPVGNAKNTSVDRKQKPANQKKAVNPDEDTSNDKFVNKSAFKNEFNKFKKGIEELSKKVSNGDIKTKTEIKAQFDDLCSKFMKVLD